MIILLVLNLKEQDFQNLKDVIKLVLEEALANAEKSGFNTNMFVEHPFIKDKKIPIYFANFVLMDYGTGAIFGCPAHDQRDFILQKYELEIIKVIDDRNKTKRMKLTQGMVL